MKIPTSSLPAQVWPKFAVNSRPTPWREHCTKNDGGAFLPRNYENQRFLVLANSSGYTRFMHTPLKTETRTGCLSSSWLNRLVRFSKHWHLDGRDEQDSALDRTESKLRRELRSDIKLFLSIETGIHPESIAAFTARRIAAFHHRITALNMLLRFGWF